jgi:hypothetical protein
MVLGIPVFSRCGVGGGFAEISRRDLQSAVSLQFVSGSSPEHAHGLNRMGLIQEMVREDGSQPIVSSYFGFITANSEESVGQAKRALEESGKGKRVPFSVAEGKTSGSEMSYSVYHVDLPSAYRWSDASQMLKEIREQIQGLPVDRHTLDAAGTAGSPVKLRTFLYAMRAALLSKATKGDECVVHNGKLYRLTWSKSRDSKTAGELARAGLMAQNHELVRIAAVIRNLKSSDETAFSVWYDGSSANVLPLRFEFRPRSFLKLVFQADQQAIGQPPEMRASLR